MRGKIISLDAQSGTLETTEGIQYVFDKKHWQSTLLPQKGLYVFFDLDAQNHVINLCTEKIGGDFADEFTTHHETTSNHTKTAANTLNHVEKSNQVLGYPYQANKHDNHLTLWQLFKRSITSHYINFKDCATQREYWAFILFTLILQTIIPITLFFIISSLLNENSAINVGITIFLAISLFLTIPSWAVAVRRLHDANLSGLWVLFLLITPPGISLIVLIIFGFIPQKK